MPRSRSTTPLIMSPNRPAASVRISSMEIVCDSVTRLIDAHQAFYLPARSTSSPPSAVFSYLRFVVRDRPALDAPALELRLRPNPSPHDSFGPVASRIVLVIKPVVVSPGLFLDCARGAIFVDIQAAAATVRDLGNRVVVIVVFKGRPFFGENPHANNPLL